MRRTARATRLSRQSWWRTGWLSLSSAEDGSLLVNGVLDPVGGAACGRRSSRWRKRRVLTTTAIWTGGKPMPWSSLPVAASRRRRSRSPARSRLCSAWSELRRRRWSSRSLSPPRRSSDWPVTAQHRSRPARLGSMVIDVGRAKRVVSEPARRPWRPRRLLPLAGLRAACFLDRRASLGALDSWRHDRPRQPHPALPPASLDGARGQLAACPR